MFITWRPVCEVRNFVSSIIQIYTLLSWQWWLICFFKASWTWFWSTKDKNMYNNADLKNSNFKKLLWDTNILHVGHSPYAILSKSAAYSQHSTTCFWSEIVLLEKDCCLPCSVNEVWINFINWINLRRGGTSIFVDTSIYIIPWFLWTGWLCQVPGYHDTVLLALLKRQKDWLSIAEEPLLRTCPSSSTCGLHYHVLT